LRIGLKKGNSPVSFQHLLAHPEGVDLGPLRPGLIDTLSRSKRRVKLLPPAMTQALPDLWAQIQAPAQASNSLKLIGRRDVRGNNSWMHNSERLVSGKARCVLWMHPQDAQARQLSHGQTVRVQSRVGLVSAPLHVTDDIKPGVVSLPHGWGHDRPGAHLRIAKDHAGVSINDLTDDQLTDAVSGNAAFSGVAVSVEAA
jgi:anaerobic selenocysteine-containing dehydrogenase